MANSNPTSPLRSPRETQANARTAFWATRNNDATASSFPSFPIALDRRRDLGQSTLGAGNRKVRPLTRNTTVMTLHSDSESELEGLSGIDIIDGNDSDSNNSNNSNDYSNEQITAEETAILFDSRITNISSMHGNMTIDESHFSSLGSESDATISGYTKRFVWHPPDTSEEDQDDMTTDDDNSSHIGPAEMFNQDSELESDQESDNDDTEEEEEEDEDHGNDGSYDTDNPYQMKNALGSYLLAPMGFDDEEQHISGVTGMEGYVEAAERFQMFAGVNEFDGIEENRSYQVISKSKKRDQERILENKRRQGKLLLVSLLDNFCLLYDQSPERNRKLFYVICKTLSNMGIIDEEYLEEMSAVRSSYQRAFRSLVLSALTSIKQEQMILESRRIMAPPSTPTEHNDGHKHSRGTDMSSQSISGSFSSKGIVPSTFLHTPSAANTAFPAAPSMMRTLSFGDMFDNDPTRYKHDFVEICKLGKGGFASVFKARNKLDGIEYAIKKIRLRHGGKVRYEKIFREIKFLARLDHKNVIRYYSSWLEHADYPMTRREIYGNDTMDSNADFDDDYDDEYGDEDDGETNTQSLCDDVSLPNRPRRKSLDYFGPHSEQHGDHPEDLSMGIVFGEEENGSNDVVFDESSRGFSDYEDAGHPIDHDSHTTNSMDTPYHPLDSQFAHGTDMERTRSTSSTLTSRDIPVGSKPSRGHKHKAPSVSQEMQGKTLAWDISEGAPISEPSPSQRSSHQSSSHSMLSSSIEEIHRSLPNSYSGSGSSLGSRYHLSEDHSLEGLQDERALRPFAFPNIRQQVHGGGFVGDCLGELHGRDTASNRSGMDPHRHLRNSTGQLITRDLTLFIQMQLCQTTLQDYLVYRNERPSDPWKTARPELTKRPSKAHRFGILSSVSDHTDQTTHSTPASPHEQTCHKDLVDPAVNQYIFRAIVEGVGYIHAQDMIHRDLKPGNIFLGMPSGTEFQRTRQQHQESFDVATHGRGIRVLTTRSSSSGSAGRSGASLVFPGLSPSLSSSASVELQPLTKEQLQEELFMNIESMVPKIGDFGLVTDMEGSASDGSVADAAGSESNLSQTGITKPGHPLLRRHSSAVTTGSKSSRSRTTAVGTVTYASPEQLARPNLGYDQKADIYSLGIIFFELYHPFSTLMERHAVLKTLRNGELPPDFVSRWPKEAAFVLWLMAEDPRMRPSANEILEFELIRKPKEESSLSSSYPVTEDSRSGTGTVAPAKVPVTERTKDLNDQLDAATAVLHGLGLSTTASTSKKGVNETGIVGNDEGNICESCKARRLAKLHRRLADRGNISSNIDSQPGVTGDGGDGNYDDDGLNISFRSENGNSRGTGQHNSSKRKKNKKNNDNDQTTIMSSSESDRQRLVNESSKVKRLELSLAAMRAENKALLDRIQELEEEKAATRQWTES
ncbi:Eukaryotic translation initiation factor 2-alpha kinase [Podila humilis]|nr:Eukaryotic translation initiation factor 2-alpha kinase [Podila humilis]